jgi:sugar phosphate isomerase/epimerase
MCYSRLDGRIRFDSDPARCYNIGRPHTTHKVIGLKVNANSRSAAINPLADRLAIVSDEAAAGFAEAVEICRPLGIRAFELRNLPGGRVPHVHPEAIAEVQAQVAAHGLRIIGISPGFCKRSLDDPAVETELATGLDAALSLLDRLRTRRMTTFSFIRTGCDAPIPPRVLDLLGRAARRCQAQGVELLIENSPQCWADTGEHLAEIATAIGLRVTWDPANAAAAGGEGYPAGYLAVRDRVAHFHAKNWRPGAGHVYINDGVVDFAGQVAALQQDGYGGYFCIESHRWSDPTATETNTRQLLDLLARPVRFSET